jgi:uncharacterized protein involved in exopolysaccharide biosynthesis
MAKIKSLIKNNVWLALVAAFVIGAGGFAAAFSKTKEYGNKVTSMAGVTNA